MPTRQPLGSLYAFTVNASAQAAPLPNDHQLPVSEQHDAEEHGRGSQVGSPSNSQPRQRIELGQLMAQSHPSTSAHSSHSSASHASSAESPLRSVRHSALSPSLSMPSNGHEASPGSSFRRSSSLSPISPASPAVSPPVHPTGPGPLNSHPRSSSASSMGHSISELSSRPQTSLPPETLPASHPGSPAPSGGPPRQGLTASQLDNRIGAVMILGGTAALLTWGAIKASQQNQKKKKEHSNDGNTDYYTQP